MGLRGEGSLVIEDGGFVSNNSSTIGGVSGSQGKVTVNGNATTWQNFNNITVGSRGMGELTIEAGAQLSSASSAIGSNSGGVGVATVTGSNSLWSHTNATLQIGLSGEGELTIAAGGRVINRNAWLGFSNSGEGELTISGAGSSWTSTGSVYVGGQPTLAAGSGVVNVSDQAVVVVDETLKIWDSGTFNLAGGSLNVETLDLSETIGGNDFDWTGGRLMAETILGSITQDGGVLAPGNSPGLTAVMGNYVLNAGIIEFEIEGNSRATDYDGLDIAGSTLLNGVLDIDLTGYSPVAGDTFNLVNATSFSGSPSFDFSGATLGSGLAWNTNNFMTSGAISVNAVPEPSCGLLATALCLIACRSLRARRPSCK